MRRERINHTLDVLRLSPDEVRAAIAEWVQRQLPGSKVTQVSVFDWYLAERVNVDVMVRQE